MTRRKSFSGVSYDHLYHEILDEIDRNPEYSGEARGKGFKEISNLSFELLNPVDHYQVFNRERNFNLGFAEKFFAWMMSGDSDITKLTGVNPNAKNYMAEGELPDNFNTAYGPRIVRQLPRVIRLLKEDPGTRRAVIHILEEGDKVIWDVETKLEYPCTHAYQFMIRDGALNLYVLMRSNNMVLTVCYDVWNTAKLLQHVAKEVGVDVGTLNFNCTSAHFFSDEQELVTKVLRSWRAEQKYYGVQAERLAADIDSQILSDMLKEIQDETQQ
jgi:thymidylate synthase